MSNDSLRCNAPVAACVLALAGASLAVATGTDVRALVSGESFFAGGALRARLLIAFRYLTSLFEKQLDLIVRRSF